MPATATLALTPTRTTAMTLTATLAIALTALSGCGTDSCPSGTVPFGDGRCVPVGCEGTMRYPDTDGDGYGSAMGGSGGCDAPPDYVASSDDCDDTNGDINPGAAEACNGIDDDCDGAVDDGLATMAFFADADMDTYGDPGTEQQACVAPPGMIATGGDCDDGNPASHPDGWELCDGEDNDCDGAIDEGLIGPVGMATFVDDTPADTGLGGGALVAAHAGGYALAWAGGDGSLWFRQADRTGALLGTPRALAMPGMRFNAEPLALTVFEGSGAGHAVVAWNRDGAVRVQSVPLDGSVALPPVTLVASEGYAAEVLEVNGEALALWTEIDMAGAAAWLMAQRLDPATGATRGSAARVYDFRTAVSAALPPTATAVPTGHVLVGLIDDLQLGPMAPPNTAHLLELSFAPDPVVAAPALGLPPTSVTNAYGVPVWPAGAEHGFIVRVRWIDATHSELGVAALVPDAVEGWSVGAFDLLSMDLRFMHAIPIAGGVGIAFGVPHAGGPDTIEYIDVVAGQIPGPTTAVTVATGPAPSATLTRLRSSSMAVARRGAEGALVYGFRTTDSALTAPLMLQPLGCM